MVFVLDGVLIGAGDLRFLAGAMVAAFALFLPAAVLAGAVGGTLLWLWGAVTLLMVARLAGVGLALRRPRLGGHRRLTYVPICHGPDRGSGAHGS